MKEAVFVSAARTPFGKYMGSLSSQRSQDLAAKAMQEAMNRAGFDSKELDVCIFSQALQSSFPANVGRHAWLLAGLAENPAGWTANTLCAGAIQTIISGFNKIVGDYYEGIMVGGVDTYSMSQYYLFHPRYEFGPQSMYFHDPKIEVQINAQPKDIYGELTSADLACITANNFGLNRSQLDEYTAASHEKAVNAIKAGLMQEVITPVVKKTKKAEFTIEKDEIPKSVSVETLMGLPAVDDCCGYATEANVAPMADGAGALVMMSADKAQALGAKPLAKMIGFGIAAGNPTLLETITARSIEKALKMAGKKLSEVDFLDIHEPSAAYALIVADKLGEEAKGKINVDGGSLAFGHAGAATGAAMTANMIYRLQRTGAKVGLINVGSLGGQSLTIVIEK
ncbi:MAG: thiolase family protein [Syntrophomonadaceae bacterium]